MRIALATSIAAVLLIGAPAAQARVQFPAAAAHVPAGGQLLGQATDDVDVLIGLKLRNEPQLDQLIANVTDPTSAQYGHYLSPDQFHARFSPSQDDVDAVKAFARAHGLTATPASNRAWVRVTGKSSLAATAFGVSLRAVQLVDRLAHIPVGTPSVPANLKGIVSGIEGLDTTHVAKPNAVTAPPAFVNAQPCGAYWGEKVSDLPGKYPYVPCGYTPQQLRSAYGIDKLSLDGKGVKVGIIDAYDAQRVPGDVNTWSGKHDLPPLQYTDVSGPLPSAIPQLGTELDPDGWSGEQTLDVEAVHAMAPGAAVVYRGAASPLNAALTQALTSMVDGNEAQIITNSYGSAEDDGDANTDALLKQAAAQGIGTYFSTGDEGDETKDPAGPGDREVTANANNPLTTGVGGTALGVGAQGQYLFETGWGTSTTTLENGAWNPAVPGDFQSGGGGGVSQAYAQPDYQAGVVPDAISKYFAGAAVENSQKQTQGFQMQVPGRAVPDVAMVGDPQTGMLVGQSQDFTSTGNLLALGLPGDDIHYSEYRVGGTSLSSPLFAGFMALADQAAGKPHGFVNPALYAAYKANKKTFRDIVDPKTTMAAVRVNYVNDKDGPTTTLLRTLNQTNTIHTVPGYDDVTGLGSPNGATLLKALAPSYTGFPADPASCKTRKSVRVKLKAPKGGRLTKLVAYVGGKKQSARSGRKLTTITVKTPKTTKALKIVATTDAHKHVTYTNKIGACGLAGKASTKLAK